MKLVLLMKVHGMLQIIHTNGLANSPALVPGVGVSGHFYIVECRRYN